MSLAFENALAVLFADPNIGVAANWRLAAADGQRKHLAQHLARAVGTHQLQ